MSKAERTREFIIEKAAPVFNRQGYAGTSLSDLLEATGLTKGALYGNFANKDEIAMEAFSHNFKWLQQGFQSAISQYSNAVDQLLAMTDFYRQHHKKLFEMGGCPILNTAVEADDHIRILSDQVQMSIKNWRALIEKIIEKGKAKHEIINTVEAGKYSVIIMSLIEGGLMLAKVNGDISIILQILDKADEIIRNEIAC